MEKSWLILPIPPKYLATELLIFTLSLNPLIYGLPNYIVIVNIYLVPARYCEVIDTAFLSPYDIVPNNI
jgi:hypothetical protein